MGAFIFTTFPKWKALSAKEQSRPSLAANLRVFEAESPRCRHPRRTEEALHRRGDPQHPLYISIVRGGLRTMEQRKLPLAKLQAKREDSHSSVPCKAPGL